MRVLVTGGAGLLGQRLALKSSENSQVLAVDIAENPFENHPRLIYHVLDLLDYGRALSVVNRFAPDMIFNCAAYTDVDGCEKNRKLARDLNVGIIENLINTKFGKLVQFSTDYVFNGKSGPYAETDPTDPVGYYGQTKLESERILKASSRDYLIIRTNVLFGTGKNVRPNFITWLIEKLRNGEEIRIVTDQFNNPIHADNLADAAIEAGTAGIDGILHVAGASYLSRYEIAEKVARHFDLNPGLIEPIATAGLGQAANRPLNGGLKIDKAKSLLKTELLAFDDALRLISL